ncbi:TPA: hypothetical protein DIC39_00925 [Patescibacteria group bacterium]|nr:MAG: hypothetical protein A2047_04315 [Omnitrophica bacterium GWA2_41_15]HCU47612.1 hypothetical protein [Patescibacteria group bacterium]
MGIIKLLPLVGEFAENKDIARDIRVKKIVPILENKDDVILDFEHVKSTTQSFIHALISELIRVYGNDVLDKLTFKNCSPVVQKIIGIVVDYMQESR